MQAWLVARQRKIGSVDEFVSAARGGDLVRVLEIMTNYENYDGGALGTGGRNALHCAAAENHLVCLLAYVRQFFLFLITFDSARPVKYLIMRVIIFYLLL